MCPLRNIVGRLFLLVLRRIVASLALTVLVQDEQGGEVCEGHVAPDQNKQRLVRS
jgi:hypothetical protein